MIIEEIRKLSDEYLNRRVFELSGIEPRWVLMKRGLYYRPKACGYTHNISEAWLVTESEADRHVYPHDEPVTKYPAPISDYCNDLGACAEMEKVLDEEQCENFHRFLDDNEPVELGPEPAAHFVFHATARQRCEAFVATMAK